MSLTIKNLNKSFDSKQVITDFSYDFDSKGLYVITGESGIGKTTLLRIIAGLDKDFYNQVFKMYEERIIKREKSSFEIIDKTWAESFINKK